MGYSTKLIPFFTDDIVIDVHTSSDLIYLKKISIAEFANNRPVRLEQREDNGEYIARCGNDFIQGPEVV